MNNIYKIFWRLVYIIYGGVIAFTFLPLTIIEVCVVRPFIIGPFVIVWWILTGKYFNPLFAKVSLDMTGRHRKFYLFVEAFHDEVATLISNKFNKD